MMSTAGGSVEPSSSFAVTSLECRSPVMPILAIHHVTTYHFRQPVAFGEHRLMMRPREGHDQRLIESQIEIDPPPAELRWLHDVFGNSVAIARFDREAAV